MKNLLKMWILIAQFHFQDPDPDSGSGFRIRIRIQPGNTAFEESTGQLHCTNIWKKALGKKRV